MWKVQFHETQRPARLLYDLHYVRKKPLNKPIVANCHKMYLILSTIINIKAVFSTFLNSLSNLMLQTRNTGFPLRVQSDSSMSSFPCSKFALASFSKIPVKSFICRILWSKPFLKTICSHPYWAKLNEARALFSPHYPWANIFSFYVILWLMTVACDASHLCVEVWGVPGLPYGRQRRGPGRRSVSWAGSAGASLWARALDKHWGEELCTVKRTHCAQTLGPGRCMCYQPDNSDRPPPTTEEMGVKEVKTENRWENIESGSLGQVKKHKKEGFFPPLILCSM